MAFCFGQIFFNEEFSSIFTSGGYRNFLQSFYCPLYKLEEFQPATTSPEMMSTMHREEKIIFC
jgi:hypothetical protein